MLEVNNQLGTARIFYYKDILRLGTAGILGGSALHGYVVVARESQLPLGRGQALF